MNERFTLLVAALLALLLGAPAVLIAQSAGQNMLSPVSPQANPGCEKYVTMNNPSALRCGFAQSSSAFAAGAGIVTNITVKNSAVKNLQINLAINCPAGINGPYNGNCPMYISLLGGTPIVGDGVDDTIAAGTTYLISLKYPAIADGTLNPPPAPKELLMGTLTMALYADDAATLDAVQVTETIAPASGRDRFLEMDVPFVSELGATPLSSNPLPNPSPFVRSSQTPADNMIVAVQNISATSQAVQISLTIDGNTIPFTTAVLGPNASYEGTIAATFGITPTADEISRGTITFEGLAGANIVSGVLQSAVVGPSWLHIEPRTSHR